MSDIKRGPWSEAETYALMLAVVKQFKLSGQSIKFDDIKIPGRSTRSITERFNKVRSEDAAASLVDNAPGAAPAVPAPRGKVSGGKKANPRKRKAKSGSDEDDEDVELDNAPPPKRTKPAVVEDKMKDEDKDDYSVHWFGVPE